MHRFAGILILIAVSAVSISSCRFLSSILRDEDIVARAGNEYLYRSEVAKLIPDGISNEDSLRLALQYINTWANDIIFLEIAEQHLSKAEKDVSKELESYRRSLLKYRYEQLYLNERLDTSVTEAQIAEYYNTHTNDFVLERPIVKARMLRISADSPNLEVMRKMMSSEYADDITGLDSLAYFSADKFTVYADKWIDIAVLARDLGIDYGALLSVKKGTFVQSEDIYGKGGYAKMGIAYISDVIESGEIPPVEFCSDRISDIMISMRKHHLTVSLEEDLIDDARKKGKFVIY